MQTVPNKSFVPWRFRRQAGLFDGTPTVSQHGWLSIQLVRRWNAQRVRAMWDLRPPTVVTPFMPPPLMLRLQAVNRGSSF
jgi:hypothetical protein